MSYQIHDLVQGSPEWLAYRAGCNNSSDLASAKNESPYKSRSEFIREVATGVTEEIDTAKQKRFDDGHRFEALARPLAEEIIGSDLYPITVSVNIDELKRPLSSSLDGATADDTINFEHKTLNAKVSGYLDNGIIPEQYHPQMEQGMLINGAEKTLFMASKWDENDNLIEEKHCWYESNKELRDQIIPVWAQLEEDAQNYQHVEPVVEVVGRTPESLPALRIEVTGMVTESNMVEFREQSLAVINSINTDLQTDQDFEDAKKTVKWLSGVEEKLEAAKNHALSQTASIDDLFRTIDDIKEESRSTRLGLNRTVTVREKARKEEIILNGKNAFEEHIKGLNNRLGNNYMPVMAADFIGVCKGLKTMSSRENAVSSELARAKIEANSIADKIQLNLKTLRDLAADYKFLFSDVLQIITKENDDLTALVKLRIAEHKEAEEARLQADRDRIRQEEEQRAKAEQERITDEAEEAAKRARNEEAANAERKRIHEESVEDRPSRKEQQAVVVPEVTTFYADPLDRPEIDKDATERNIMVSLINNGVGQQSAKKIAKLLILGKISNVNVSFSRYKK